MLDDGDYVPLPVAINGVVDFHGYCHTLSVPPERRKVERWAIVFLPKLAAVLRMS